MAAHLRRGVNIVGYNPIWSDPAEARLIGYRRLVADPRMYYRFQKSSEPIITV
jgi:hypothetical protein